MISNYLNYQDDLNFEFKFFLRIINLKNRLYQKNRPLLIILFFLFHPVKKDGYTNVNLNAKLATFIILQSARDITCDINDYQFDDFESQVCDLTLYFTLKLFFSFKSYTKG